MSDLKQTLKDLKDPANASERDALQAEVERMRDALRLIELFGYREAEDFGWINAHMRGVATDALEGIDLAPRWRLFPTHRPQRRDR